MSMSGDTKVIKLRGLPWNVSCKEIMDFLKDINVENGEKGVHLAISPRDGRPNGEAFVECATEEDFNKAFDYNKNILGHRYIEIFSAKLDEFEFVLKRQNVVQHDTFVKLRGLPYSCQPEDIEKFFEGLEIRNSKEGIHIVVDNKGRSTGEAFVQFTSPEDTEKALKKNRDKIGHRYIEIFRSSSSECRRTTIFSRPTPYDRNDRGNSRGSSGRNSRNFRDRPYDSPWGGMGGGGMDGPFRGGNRGGNFGNNGNDMFGNNNFNNDNFGRSGNGFNNFNSSNFGNDFNRDTFGGNFGGNGNSNAGNGGGFGSLGLGGNNNGGGNNGSFMGGGGNSFGGANNSNGSTCGPPYNPGNTFLVHLRGMPYDCGEKEIVAFFDPINVVHCEVIYNNNGRHTGEADTYFATFEDAQDAMKRHKEKMGARYIELFFNKNRYEDGGDRRGGGNARRF